MTNEAFDDIRIVDMNETKTHNPDLTKLLYNIYFHLSDYPPTEWAQLFDQEHRFPRHTMWRRAWIEGDCIVRHAALNEVQEHHLPFLRSSSP